MTTTRTRGRPRTFDREQALSSALEVFCARGYEGATLDELQQAMGGITPPSFYAAFGSKERLFHEAVDLYMATAGSRPPQALAAADIREAIEAMMRVSVEVFCSTDGPRGCLLVLGAINSTRAGQEAHEYLHAIRQKAPDLIRTRLDRAVAEGQLPKGLDLAGIASFYTTVLHGLAIRARDGASRAALGAAVDGAMAAWPSLTSAKPARSRGPRARSRR